MAMDLNLNLDPAHYFNELFDVYFQRHEYGMGTLKEGLRHIIPMRTVSKITKLMIVVVAGTLSAPECNMKIYSKCSTGLVN